MRRCEAIGSERELKHPHNVNIKMPIFRLLKGAITIRSDVCAKHCSVARSEVERRWNGCLTPHPLEMCLFIHVFFANYSVTIRPLSRTDSLIGNIQLTE